MKAKTKRAAANRLKAPHFTFEEVHPRARLVKEKSSNLPREAALRHIELKIGVEPRKYTASGQSAGGGFLVKKRHIKPAGISILKTSIY